MIFFLSLLTLDSQLLSQQKKNKMTQSTSSNNKLQGKVVIITEGANGMGEDTACEFAAHGARAIIIADIQDEKGQNAV